MKETGNSKHIYENELDKASCDIAYFDSKDLTKKLFQKRFCKIELMKLL